jgi:hypothetical protein
VSAPPFAAAEGGGHSPLTRAEARHEADELRRLIWSLRYDLEDYDPGRARVLERVEEIEDAAVVLLRGLGEAA